jgi:hypothetical protein
MTRVLRIAFFASLVASACGGVAYDGLNDGDAGTGGYAYGGQGAAPGTGGKSGGTGGRVVGAGGKVTGGGKGGSGNIAGYESGPGGSIGIAGYYGAGGLAGTGGAACCKAIPTCNPGDQQLAGACPPDASCYAVTACCTTAWCRHDSTCTPKVSPCLPNDKQIFGSCPAGRSCYQRMVCGSVATCLSGALADGGTCGGPAPRGVHYVSTSLEKCALIDYACPSGTTGYSDACGCGCRQPDTCPDYVNCQPTPAPGPMNPLCAANGPCPYSIRAL